MKTIVFIVCRYSQYIPIRKHFPTLTYEVRWMIIDVGLPRLDPRSAEYLTMAMRRQPSAWKPYLRDLYCFGPKMRTSSATGPRNMDGDTKAEACNMPLFQQTSDGRNKRAYIALQEGFPGMEVPLSRKRRLPAQNPPRLEVLCLGRIRLDPMSTSIQAG